MPACLNCLADVPEERLEMHVAFCSRNVWRCTACGECMQRGSAQEEHAEQCSAAVLECECGEKLSRSALERHKKEACLMRTVECEFCEVTFTCVELMDHQEYCGSRTENCTRCLKLVKMRDMERHQASGCELYGATATAASSPDGAAGAATHGVATSLLSPFGGGGMAGGGTSRSSPGLFACPYCGSEEASFEGLQSHISEAGCGQAIEQSRPRGDPWREEQPRGRPRRRQAPARPGSDVAAALAGVTGDPSRRQRRTARDWDAEMAEALAGRAARRGGVGVATASAAAGGPRAAEPRNALDLSDGESSDDEDWQPQRAQANRSSERRSSDGVDEDVSFSESEDDWAVAHAADEDADLHKALQLSREAARPASRDSMDEDLQRALAASRSEADGESKEVARPALPEQARTNRAGRKRGAAGGGRPPPGAEVLVLDSSDGSEEEDEDALQTRAKHRRLHDT